MTFLSEASNLDPDDGDTTQDVFVRDVLGAPAPPPPAPAGPQPAPPPRPPDVTAPAARLSGSSSQKLGGAVVVSIVCPDTACRATVSGTVHVPTAGPAKAKTYKLKTATRSLRKATSVKIRLKLSATATTAIRRVLKAGTRIIVKVQLTVVDAAGNMRTLTRQVRLRRRLRR